MATASSSSATLGGSLISAVGGRAVGRTAGKPGSLSAAADWSLLVIPGVIWGASFLFIAEGLGALAPDGVAFVRVAIGFAALSIVPAARRPIDRRDWRGIAWLGVLWFAFPMSMFPHAEQHVSSALAGMLNGATPLFVTAVASILARQLPSRAIVGGLIVGLIGAILVAAPTIGEGASSTIGILQIVAALACYGVAFNLARPLQQRSGALPVVLYSLAVAVVLTAPLGIPAVLHATWTPRAILSLLALGALGTSLATVLVAVAAGRVGAARASATTFLIPAVALALGVLVRGEQVSAIAVLGGGVCLAGAWIVRRATM